jgi:sugar/nucleoside kinase (ribokinase family)
LSVAQAKKVHVAFTASAEFVDPPNEMRSVTSVLPLTTMLLANEGEAMLLTGSSSPDEALSKLAALAPSIVITLGKEGAQVLITVRHGEYAHTPHAPVIDTTGAGDDLPAFLAGLVRNQPVEIAARGAAHMASIVITRRGAHPPKTRTSSGRNKTNPHYPISRHSALNCRSHSSLPINSSIQSYI